MKKIRIIIVFCCLLSGIIHAQDLKLWYEKPASQWVEAMPIGNGFIGAMVFGNVENELIQLNEGTLWSGGPRKKNVNPDAHKYLQPIREALAKGDYATATELCRKMQGHFTESFIPMGDLHIKHHFNGRAAESYHRELRLNDAVSLTEFTVTGIKYKREVFTSAPDSIMVVRITADRPGRLTLDITLSSLLVNTLTPVGNNQINMSGKAPARVDPSYYNKSGRNPILQEDPENCNGMRFQTILKAVNEGGTIEVDTTGIHIRDADNVILFLAAATSFNGFDKCPDSEGKDEKAISERYLEDAQKKSYEELLSAHVKDFRKYFDRVSFTLSDISGSQVNKKTPSDLRLKLYSYGNHDPELETIYFQFGRYLLISCSRPGGSAANLQGLWNKELRPPWSSNYTININTQMNYWPAETANLSEMHKPLLSWITALSKTGTATAREYYKAKGWVAHHNSDIWGLSNAVGNLGDGSPTWANWYMGAGWLCQHLWEHYVFTADKEFLRKEAYPVMKQAALFCLDWLFEKDGYLITSPSTSPENEFVIDGKRFAVAEASTMDMAIIWELFGNLIEASEILNTDRNLRKQLMEKRNKLFPYQIGSEGQLLEWSKEYKEVDKRHRHLSHLYGLHPGKQISPLTSPELAEACRKSLEIRGDEGTGWSKGWKINFAARLLDGDHAYKLVREIMNYIDVSSGNTRGGGTYPNFFDAHPPFQIDGNFGATAGIIEMLLQSHLNEIHLLPALPKAWTAGEIKGLKARGNFEIDIQWENNHLVEAMIISNEGGKCILRTSLPVQVENTASERKRDGDFYLTVFQTEKGEKYNINCRK